MRKPNPLQDANFCSRLFFWGGARSPQMTSRWLAVYLDVICAIFVTVVAFGALTLAETLNPGKIGLVLSLALTLTLTGMFQCCVRQSIEAENMMISVERGIEYTECEKEALWEYKFRPPPAWPHRGVIDSYNVNFRYSLDEPLILKDLIPCIFSSEKVGIMGRTGAGKSSLIAALLRLSEPGGRILIDDIWTTEIGLHDLRKKMTVAPQEPVLFTGTMRKNLDPFNEHMDVELWKVLEEVQLKEAIEGLPGKMNAELAESGLNLSSGQRELVCLARAILRENQILIIDKATSNVDTRFWIQGDWKNMMNHLFCCKIETVCFTRRCNNWARQRLLPSLKGQNRCTLKGNSQILQ